VWRFAAASVAVAAGATKKGRIVAESYARGAVEVARRHEMSPQHFFSWRKAARDGRLAASMEVAKKSTISRF